MIFDLSAFNSNLHLHHDTFKTLTFYKNKETKKERKRILPTQVTYRPSMDIKNILEHLPAKQPDILHVGVKTENRANIGDTVFSWTEI